LSLRDGDTTVVDHGLHDFAWGSYGRNAYGRRRPPFSDRRDPQLIHGAIAGVDSVPADRTRLWPRTMTMPTPPSIESSTLTDAEAVEAMPRMGRTLETFVRAADWRDSHLERKAPREHDNQPERRQKRAAHSSGGGRSAVQRARSR
jgi:hypothetical protein